MTTDTSKQQYKSNSQSVVLNYNYASLARAGDGMTVSTLFMLNGYCCCLRGQYFRTTFPFPVGEASIIHWDESVGGKTTLMSEMVNALHINKRRNDK
ncbi:hypothetical protein V9M40_004175 [Salmonella enterica subsp. enterica serovar Newport]